MKNMKNHNTPFIRTSPAARIHPPSPLGDDRWTVDDLLHHRRLALPAPGVLLTLACMQPQVRCTVIGEVAQRLGLDESAVDRVATALEDKFILISTETEETRWFETIHEQWVGRGWVEAADYHLLTFDYPFLDYSADGRAFDHQRMAGYRSAEPDLDRSKTYLDASMRIPIPTPDEALVSVSFGDAWAGRAEAHPLDQTTLGAIASMCFGKIGEYWDRTERVEPVLRRTSPSGGGRHPTEAYIVAVDVLGLARGWYHVAVTPPELELLCADTNPEELTRLFPGPFVRAPFPVTAIVVLTSVFERNMYRYREPRTFRTVHMDVGHLTSSLETIAAAYGVQAFAHYGLDDAAIERKLGLDGLVEGAMLAIALGNRAATATPDGSHAIRAADKA